MAGATIASAPLRVMIVDDTIVYRRILTEVVEAIGGAELIGTAPHGRLALSKLEKDPVDLVLLDLEMPEMDGIETLKHLRALHPKTGVIMVSGTSRDSADTTMRALEHGALDFVRKPEGLDPQTNRAELIANLRPLFQTVLARRRPAASTSKPAAAAPAPRPAPAAAPAAPAPPAVETKTGTGPGRINAVVIGVSTGGPNALGVLLPQLPGKLGVPVLLVQHMPPVFTASLAEHLSKRCQLGVREARDGEAVEPNTVLIAPGGRHMVVRKGEGLGPLAPLRIGLNDGPPENSCRPAVDVLFRSAAAHYGGNVLAVILTGMGSDGREGVRCLKRKGAYCLTQSGETCVVYGMPLAVDEAGLSDERIPLDKLATRIAQIVSRGQAA